MSASQPRPREYQGRGGMGRGGGKETCWFEGRQPRERYLTLDVGVHGIDLSMVGGSWRSIASFHLEQIVRWRRLSKIGKRQNIPRRRRLSSSREGTWYSVGYTTLFIFALCPLPSALGVFTRQSYPSINHGCPQDGLIPVHSGCFLL